MDRLPFLSLSDYEALLALSEALLRCGRKTQVALSIVCREARKPTEADGTTILLREGDAVHCVEEDAIGPLWKGQRLPAKVPVVVDASLTHTGPFHGRARPKACIEARARRSAPGRIPGGQP